jgi:hypothetical protein
MPHLLEMVQGKNIEDRGNPDYFSDKVGPYESDFFLVLMDTESYLWWKCNPEKPSLK